MAFSIGNHHYQTATILFTGLLLLFVGGCEGEDDVIMLVVDGSSSVVLRGLNASSQSQYVIQGKEDITDIDLDFHTGYLYWSDAVRKGIYRARLNQENPESGAGGEEELVVTSFSPKALALDWLSRNLYWSNTDEQGDHAILYQPLDGSLGARTLLINLYHVSHMVVHPAEKMLFWVDKGLLRNAGLPNQFWEHSKIEATLLLNAESHRKVLTQDELGEPTALTLDYVEKKLYWADSLKDSIERMDFDGQNKETVIARLLFSMVSGGELQDPHGIAIYQSQVYWSEPSKKSIYQGDKNGARDSIQVNTEEGFVYPGILKIYSRQQLMIAGSCPSPWVLMEEHCYLFVSEPARTFQDAKTFCEGAAVQSRLVSVNTLREQWALETHLMDHYPTNKYWWTSGQVDAEGTWRWGGNRSAMDWTVVQSANPPTPTDVMAKHSAIVLSRRSSVDMADILDYIWVVLEKNLTAVTICEQPTFSMDPCSENKGNCQHNCVLEDENSETGARGYYCTCPQGYRLHTNRRDCEDLDECDTLQPCDPDSPCVNTPGSYRCTCQAGYQWSVNTMACVSATSHQCGSSTNPCDHDCIDTGDGYECECFHGYELGENGHSCLDIDECQAKPNPCEQQCTNRAGGYSCSCGTNFTLSVDGRSCDLIQCPQDPPQLDGLTIQCPDGSLGPRVLGTRCRLRCIDGRISGTTYMECGEDGQWNTPTSQCVLQAPTPAPNGTTTTPMFAIYLSPSSVPETSPSGFQLAWLRVVRDGVGDWKTQMMHTFTLNNHRDMFELDSLGIKLLGQLDYETTRSYNLSVTVSDIADPSLSFTDILLLSVQDMNEAPSTPQLSNTHIPENSPNGTIIGRLTSHDPDFGQTVTFRLMNQSGLTRLDGEHLIVAKEFDHESSDEYYVTVVATDNGTPQNNRAAAYIRILIDDVNEPPTDIILRPRIIPEYVPQAQFSTTLNQEIGSFHIQDPDDADQFHLELISQGITSPELENRTCFKIGTGGTGSTDTINQPVLRVNDLACFDYELQASFAIVVNVTDSGGLSLVKRLMVFVKNMNDAPTGIVFTANPLAANAPLGTVAGTLAAIDDSGTHVFDLPDGSPYFAIKGNNLTVSGVLEHGKVTFQVRTTDRNRLSYTGNITVDIMWPDTPPSITITLASAFVCTPPPPVLGPIIACISEATQPGTAIAEVSVSDVTANVSVYNAAQLFAYRDKRLFLTQSLDYETRVEKYEELYVHFEDRFQQNGMNLINVQIIEANDPPYDIDLDNSLVPYGALRGYVVGRFRCMDEDKNDSHTFNLVTNQQFFYVNRSSGVISVRSGPLAVGEYNLTVVCFDKEGVSSPWEVFTLEVQQKELTDVQITLTGDTVHENVPQGTVIGKIFVETSREDEFYLELENKVHLPFIIDRSSSSEPTLMVARALDYEQQGYYHIVIKARASTMVVFANFTIKIVDVHEAPESLELDTSVVAEGPPGRKFGVVYIVGGEPATTYELTTTSEEFTLVVLSAGTSAIYTKSTLDYESQTRHYLAITATSTEDRNVSLTRNFTVFVMNVNEPPTMISFMKTPVKENMAAPLLAATVEIADPDGPPDGHDCSVTDGGLNWFTVGQKLGHVIQIQTTIPLDYEDERIAGRNHQVILNVMCWDWLGLSISSTTTISIQDVNEPPTDLTTLPLILSIPENIEPADPDSLIGTLHAVDPDVGDTFRYSLPSMLSGPFLITGNELRTMTALDYEKQSVHTVDVAVQDRNGNRFMKELTVTVEDVNEAPTRISLILVSPLLENSPRGTLVGELHTQDEDNGQHHTYTIHSQVPSGALQLRGSSLIVANSSALDYEQFPYISMSLSSLDNGHPAMQFTHTIRIPIQNVNEAPTGIRIIATKPDGTVIGGQDADGGNNRVHISEQAKAGDKFAKIIVEDDDKDQFFFCSLPISPWDSQDAPFQHSSSDGWEPHTDENNFIELTADDILDYETTPEYNITVVCMDNGGLHTSKSFTVHIDDADEPPRGVLVAPWDDKQPINGMMPNLELLISQDFGFQNSVVTAPESIGDAVQDRMIIAYMYVVDEDNLKKKQEERNTITVITEEEFKQGLMGSRKKRQSLSTRPNVTFSVEYGSPWQRLVAKGTLDFEKVPSHTIFIKCESDADPTQKVYDLIHLRVSDVKEPPTQILLQPASIPENAQKHTPIGRLTITDQDRPRKGYQISVEPKNMFYVDNSTLYLLNDRRLDYETTPEVTARVKVTENEVTRVAGNSTLELTQSITVTIQDVNEAPCCLTFDTGATLMAVNLGAEIGKVIGRLTVQDEDVGDKHTFRLLPSNHPSISNVSLELISIQDDQLMLSGDLSASTVDVSSVLILTVEATDQSGLTTTALLYVAFTPAPIPKPKPCTENSCLGNAYCDKSSGEIPRCKCLEGYTGLSCDVAESQCEGVTCTRNGQCIAGTKQYTCRCSQPFSLNCSSCAPGYSGDNCHICHDCEISAASSGADKSLSYLAYIVGGIVAMLVLIIIILLLVYIIRRQKRRQQKSPVVQRRVRYDSTDGRISISGVQQPDQYANPLYSTIGDFRHARSNGTTEVYNEMFENPTDNNHHNNNGKLAAHMEAMNYHPPPPHGRHGNQGPSNDLDSGVVEDSSDPGDAESGATGLDVEEVVVNGVGGSNGQRGYQEADRDLSVITVPQDSVIDARHNGVDREGNNSSGVNSGDRVGFSRLNSQSSTTGLIPKENNTNQNNNHTHC